MSKSLGNFYTVRGLLDEFPGEALRLTLLQTHYRQPMDFTKDGVRQAKAMLDRFYGALRGRPDQSAETSTPDPVVAALSDDLNTPLALSELHRLLDTLNTARRGGQVTDEDQQLRAAGRILGLLQQDPEDWFRWQATDSSGFDDAQIDAMIEARRTARAEKNFAEADRIRDELADAGVVLEDKAEGTVWRRQ